MIQIENATQIAPSILIVEDEALVAMDLESRLVKLGYRVTSVFSHSDKAINHLSIHSPDLVLCDININGPGDGIDVAMYVREHKKIPLVFLTALSDKSTLDRAKKALPYGYIVKPFEDDDLKTSIEMALYKYNVEQDKLAVTKDKIAPLVSDELSAREYEVLHDILKGLSNAEIAELRYVSINTIKFHVSNVFRKFEVRSRAELLQKILTLYT